ncbi:hypothetical protein ABEF92_003796 [Exophiala dermatitidis]|uniref:Uncharacterized protein n=1 Tax=Exophiala dermatitidis (strain ATCC 34100 / CBS 525.76 / NIH/UT8656) TaxID=858893 RepID=H6BZL8_EXODN|nr:uncharacterized protein HMPREF1120_05131 [Exophiala dermatitidis NIH/UT8656]EHY57081.1 hypothetical protein HMPREF1120_05131 [Exophiala dermatitidis NIH/UT8656]KAJ4600620.1 hypothetical protein HRR85_009177 [Exophiala dermatitidis]
MSTDDSDTVAFSYIGTAETIFDLKILGDFCATNAPRTRRVVQEEYNRQFSNGVNFTFIQCGEDVLTPPMDWLGDGEDDAGTFKIFRPQEADNPYVQLKVGRISRGEKDFELHVFYRHLKVTTDYIGLLNIMIKLDVPSIIRELLLFRCKAHAALSEVYESHLAQDSVTSLNHYLQQMRDLEGLLGRRSFEDETALLTKVESVYRLSGSIHFLKAFASVSTPCSKPAGRELAYTIRDDNIVDMDNLYCEWAG